MKKQSWIALLGLIIYFNLFLFRPTTMLTFVLMSAGVVVFGLILSRKWWPTHRRVLLPWLGAVAIIWLALLWRNYPFVQFVGVVALLGVLVYGVYLLLLRLPFFGALREMVLAPLMVFQGYLLGVMNGIREMATGISHPRKQRVPVQAIVLGLVASLPIVGLLLLLLSGDPVYAKFLQQLFHLNIPERWAVRTAFSLFLLVFFLPFTFMAGLKLKPHFPRVHLPLSLGPTVHTIIVLVGAILLSYLVVQWPYVFANVKAETDLSRFGVATYSEYVTRGFIELLIVSCLIYAVIWGGLVMWRRYQSKWLGWTQLALLGLYGIYLLSMFRRVWLYQAFHGLTLVRWYGLVFLVFVTGLGIFVTLRHFYRQTFVRYEVAFLGLILLFTLGINAEHLIATYRPPTVNGEIDYVYLARMSPDGITGWQKAYTWAKQTISNQDWLADGVINAEERRELAHAGMVLAELARSQTPWIINDADAAAKARTKQFVAFQKDTIERWLQINETYTAGLSSTDQLLRQGVGQENFQHITAHLKTLNEIQLDSVAAITYPGYLGYLTYSLNECNDYMCLPLGSFVMNRPEHLKSLTDRERWLTWHGGNRMRQQAWFDQVSFEEYLTTYRQFFDLYFKVMNQPASEWDYQRDRSLQSPLL